MNVNLFVRATSKINPDECYDNQLSEFTNDI